MEQTRDIFFMVAAKFIITNKTASITALQKDLKIDCNRAAKIISELEEAGLIGLQEGKEPRKVLFDNMLSFVKSLPRREEEIREHEWILHLDFSARRRFTITSTMWRGGAGASTFDGVIPIPGLRNLSGVMTHGSSSPRRAG